MKPKDTDIPIAFLRECFVLDPQTGRLMWRVRPREHFPTLRSAASTNGRLAGKPTGSLDSKGYLQIWLTIGGQRRGLLAHRSIFALTHGRWPADEVDHRSGASDDNAPGNLREATHNQNRQNLKLFANNTSGFTGVSWDARHGKWQGNIGIGGRLIHLGRFATPEAAYAAYLKAKTELHPFQPAPR